MHEIVELRFFVFVNTYCIVILVVIVKVGDGTTTVVLLAAEFLREAKPFIEDGVHSQNLIRSYRTACSLAIEKVKELATSIEGKSLEEKKSLLAKCAATTLSSKLIGGEKEFFATMVVDAVIAIGTDDRLNMIGIKKVPVLLLLQPCIHMLHKSAFSLLYWYA